MLGECDILRSSLVLFYMVASELVSGVDGEFSSIFSLRIFYLRPIPGLFVPQE